MERNERPEAQRNAGAFMGPDLLVPAPMSTLSDELDDERHDGQLRREREGWLARLVRRMRPPKR
jgi:hypothetical protein